MLNPFLKVEWLKEGRNVRLPMIIIFYNAILAFITILFILFYFFNKIFEQFLPVFIPFYHLLFILYVFIFTPFILLPAFPSAILPEQ